jgi:hypothetical protein
VTLTACGFLRPQVNGIRPLLRDSAAGLDDMHLGCEILLLAAADDPFHCTDVIAPGMTAHKNDRFIGMVTHHGGHIGWTRLSDTHLAGLDFGFVGEVRVCLLDGVILLLLRS